MLWPSVNNTGGTSFGSVFITFLNTSADMNSKLHWVCTRTLVGRRVRRWSPCRLGRRGVASVGFLQLRVLGKIELERRRLGFEDVRPCVNLEPHVDQATGWHVIDVLVGEAVRQLCDAGVVPDAGNMRGLGWKGPDDAPPLSGFRQVQPVIEHDPLFSVTDRAGDKCGGVAGALGSANEEQIRQPVALG